jgi:ribosomal protein L33
MNKKALLHCAACGDHAAHKSTILECNSCGSAMYSSWESAPSSPIAELLAEYAGEFSDFSGQAGYEFALMIAKRYAECGPDSQMRCVVYTLLTRLDANNH